MKILFGFMLVLSLKDWSHLVTEEQIWNISPGLRMRMFQEEHWMFQGKLGMFEYLLGMFSEAVDVSEIVGISSQIPGKVSWIGRKV